MPTPNNEEWRLFWNAIGGSEVDPASFIRRAPHRITQEELSRHWGLLNVVDILAKEVSTRDHLSGLLNDTPWIHIARDDSPGGPRHLDKIRFLRATMRQPTHSAMPPEIETVSLNLPDVNQNPLSDRLAACQMTMPRN